MTNALDKIIKQPAAAPIVAAPPVSASSTGGSPFGVAPIVPPEQAANFSRVLSNLVYSVDKGGWMFADEARNANSWYNKFGAGGGGDPAANAQAASVFGAIGTYPTRNVGTAALEKLYQRQGITGTLGPSYNERLGQAGMEGYKGPWEFGPSTGGFDPYSYHPFEKIKRQYGWT